MLNSLSELKKLSEGNGSISAIRLVEESRRIIMTQSPSETLHG
jgi:hypothetical protein